MAIKTYRPTTQTLRYRTTLVNDDITTEHPHKPLTRAEATHRRTPQFGRHHHALHGGGHKRKLRIIDFKRDKTGIPATVTSIEYDPNRSSRIALLAYADGEKRYILQPEGLEGGAESGQRSRCRHSGRATRCRCGIFRPARRFTIIELKPGKGGQMVRSAGGAAQLVAKEGEYALVNLPSGETRKVSQDCMATMGQVGNIDHENVTIGKAGRSRWLGIVRTNRGVSMNPVDHPHGGGEGKTSGGRHPVTPWGQPTRGYKTRNNKRTDKFIVSRSKYVGV